MSFFSFCIQEKEMKKKKEKRNRLKILKSEYTVVDKNKMMEAKQNMKIVT